jgi:hypothetical protein
VKWLQGTENPDDLFARNLGRVTFGKRTEVHLGTLGDAEEKKNGTAKTASDSGGVSERGSAESHTVTCEWGTVPPCKNEPQQVSCVPPEGTLKNPDTHARVTSPSNHNVKKAKVKSKFTPSKEPPSTCFGCCLTWDLPSVSTLHNRTLPPKMPCKEASELSPLTQMTRIALPITCAFPAEWSCTCKRTGDCSWSISSVKQPNCLSCAKVVQQPWLSAPATPSATT